MSGSPESAESKRRYPRYPLDIRITVRVFRSGETISLWGRTSEIAQDGVGATLTGELEPNEVVSIELAVPLATYPLKFRALVRYRMGLRHGFEFLIRNPEQRESINRLCEMLALGTR